MLGPLQAEQQLAAVEAASVPHMKPQTVNKVMSRLLRRVTPEEKKPQSLHEALMAAGVPVRYVPKQEDGQDVTGQAGTGRKDESG